MLTYIIRAYGYTLLTHDTRFYILGLEILHGFTFAGMWISAKKNRIKRVPYNIYQYVLNLFDKYKLYDDPTCRILAIHCERWMGSHAVPSPGNPNPDAMEGK